MFGGVTCLTLLVAAFFISSWRPRDVFRSWGQATEEQDQSKILWYKSNCKYNTEEDKVYTM